MVPDTKALDSLANFNQRVRKADVVRVADPLDPSRTVLRRVIGLPGQKIKVDDQGVRINGKRLRQEEMGDLDGKRVLKEVIWSSPPARANAYLPMIADQPGGWKNETPVEVPEGYLYLMADNRDGALDSRWWGPVPLSAVQGVVRLRVGKADTWRPQWELMIPKE